MQQSNTITAIQKLSLVAQNDIFAVASGSGCYATDIPVLCIDMVNIIERFLDPAADVDLSNSIVQDFLKQTLPALSEIFLRRVTLRYTNEYDNVSVVIINRFLVIFTQRA